MRYYSASCLALSVALFVAETAAAQAPPSPTSPLPPTATQPDPRACQQPAQPRTGSGAPTTGETPPPLGERLARTDGVICPPKGVDPEIVAPTPEVGRMPVIRPPGSPGGDPTVRPK